jgi:phosphonoacetaldehyde hydrolase
MSRYNRAIELNRSYMMQYVFRRSYRGALKAVILDWAGTTVDFGSRAPVLAFVELFKSRGVPITIQEARTPMGMHKKDHIRSLVQMEAVAQRWRQAHGRAPGERDVEALYQAFIPIQIAILAAHAAPIPGAIEAVAAFRARGLKIGSTTGYNQEMMDVLLPAAQDQGYSPDCAVCASDVPAGRPEPWMALLCAMRLRTYPLEAVVKVGDTSPDIAAGLNAGMWTIGVAKTGNTLGMNRAEIDALEPDDLRERLADAYAQMYQAGAHFVVDSIAEVPSVLDEIKLLLARGAHPSAF